MSNDQPLPQSTLLAPEARPENPDDHDDGPHGDELGIESKEVAPENWNDDEDVFALPAAGMRTRALPIRPGDLTRLLMQHPDVDDSERKTLGQLARLLGATFHHEFYERLRELKEAYAPLDPDSDHVHLPDCTLPAREDQSEHFLHLLTATLDLANYHVLDLETIKAAVEAPNELGLSYTPDFELFRHLRIYVRGYTRITRESRTVQTKFLKKSFTLDAYQRMIVALQFQDAGKRLGPNVRSDVVYLRMFKDVPHVDMEMHLPEQGTKVKMRMLDKAQIASPLAVSIPTIILKGLGLATVGGVGALIGLVVAPITAGVNSFFGFQRAKQKHLSHMIRNLYYMTLANNTSVLNRLIDSGEEEEYKETLLAYFFLWQSLDRKHEPWDEKRLDAQIEAYLLEKTGREIDFEIHDALDKLFRLGLARQLPDGSIQARPIEEALVHLDRLWDNTFRYAKSFRDRSSPSA
ncbi:MAG: DUF3754 domain-containing protein [Isosphaeraceae bacterium]|nr:DUF3754 domain-containing protein [Isosphaeraceae bacterium]